MWAQFAREIERATTLLNICTTLYILFIDVLGVSLIIIKHLSAIIAIVCYNLFAYKAVALSSMMTSTFLSQIQTSLCTLRCYYYYTMLKIPLLCLCLGGFCACVYDQVVNYFEGATSTKIKVEYEDPKPFPTVVFCPSNNKLEMAESYNAFVSKEEYERRAKRIDVQLISAGRYQVKRYKCAINREKIGNNLCKFRMIPTSLYRHIAWSYFILSIMDFARLLSLKSWFQWGRC